MAQDLQQGGFLEEERMLRILDRLQQRIMFLFIFPFYIVFFVVIME